VKWFCIGLLVLAAWLALGFGVALVIGPVLARSGRALELPGSSDEEGT
jgi:hypothetical protein